MIYPQIVNYIKDSLAKKVPIDQIKNSLLANGWRESDINEAIALNSQSLQPASTPAGSPVKGNKGPAKKIPLKTLLIIGGGVAFLLILGLVIFFLANSSKNISSTDLLQGTLVNLGTNKEVKFNIGVEQHRIVVGAILDNSASIVIYSTPISATLKIGEEQRFDLNSDNNYDLLLKLNNINNQKVDLYVQEINEPVCIEAWECSDWSKCVNSTQSRTCNDINSCGSDENRPSEIQVCIPEIVPVNLTCSEKNGDVCEVYEECNGTLEDDCCIGNCTRISTTACGSDINCLINASKTCHPANLTYGTYSSNSTIQNTTYFYRVDGYDDKEGTKCEFYGKIENIVGNFSEEEWNKYYSQNYTTEQIMTMLQTLHNDMIGSYVSCIFSTSDLEDYLIDVKNGNSILTADDLVAHECTGDLY